MKLRAVLEVEVPDDVGRAVLDQQAHDAMPPQAIHTFEQTVFMDVWSYRITAPLKWEREE